MKKRNILKENDCQPLTTITFAHGNDDARRITIAYKKRRGRPKQPIPNANILNEYDKTVLSNPQNTLEKMRTYERLYKQCGNSFTVLKRFLDKYYPVASRDRKILRKYVKTYSLVKDAVDYVLQKHNNNPLVTKEELEELVYCYIKTKLRRIVQTSIEFSGLLETYTSEGDAK